MAPDAHAPLSSRYVRAAWAFVVYTIGVILWGAYVRASLSGDGCGDHWPLCNGEVVPTAPSTKTVVELTHRVTSGLAWFFALGFVFWSRRAAPAGHRARRGAGLSLLLMTTEALVGAGLVIFEMVASSEEVARGYWAIAHLVNTLILLAALTAHAHWAGGGGRLLPARGRTRTTILALLGGMVALSATGAIAALGNTLFPTSSLAEGWEQDLDPSSHVFLRLRISHPILAIAVGAATMAFAGARAVRERSRLAFAVAALVVAQLGLGLLNLTLHAPIWLQLVHLGLADAIWIALLLVASEPRAAG